MSHEVLNIWLKSLHCFPVLVEGVLGSASCDKSALFAIDLALVQDHIMGIASTSSTTTITLML